MLRFQWNALRKGDKVLVHGPGRLELTLSPGVVEMVEPHKKTNGLGILVGRRAATSQLVWPSYLAVHSDPRDPSDSCWRCRALAELDKASPETTPAAEAEPS